MSMWSGIKGEKLSKNTKSINHSIRMLSETKYLQ